MPLLARAVNTPLAVEIRHGAIRELGAILADQRISSGAPGTLSTFFGVSALRSQTTMVLPNFFMASASPTSLPIESGRWRWAQRSSSATGVPSSSR